MHMNDVIDKMISKTFVDSQKRSQNQECVSSREMRYMILNKLINRFDFTIQSNASTSASRKHKIDRYKMRFSINEEFLIDLKKKEKR